MKNRKLKKKLLTNLINCNMTKMKHLLSQLYLLALLALPVFVASCSEDDEPQGEKMEIAGLGADNGVTVVTDQTIELKAELVNAKANISYAWAINGGEVSTESSYTFKSETAGNYTVTLTVREENNAATEVTKSITIKVVKPMFYVINEGQLGTSPASINRYDGEAWQYRIIEGLGNTGTIARTDGTYMYIVCKDQPQLTKIALNGYATIGTIELGSGKANNFCILNDTEAILTTTTGAYKVNPVSMTLGEKLDNTSNSKDICHEGNYLFILDGNTIKVYNAETMAFEKELPHQAVTGFARTLDGTLWAANGTKLIKIDIETLESKEVELPDGLKVFNDRYAYKLTSLQASVSENVLYIANAPSFSATDIYKYDTMTGEATLFFTAPKDYSIYGSCVQVDPRNGDVYLAYTEDGFGSHYLNTYIYVTDGVSGEQKAKLDYTGEYWFPSMILFE